MEREKTRIKHVVYDSNQRHQYEVMASNTLRYRIDYKYIYLCAYFYLCVCVHTNVPLSSVH